MQGLALGVVDESPDVIAVAQHLGRLHRRRIDAIEDRAAVRSVLRSRHPDRFAVIVHAARVVHRAFTQRQIGDEVAFRVELDEMPDPFAGVSVVTILQLRVARRLLPDIDRRDEIGIADLHHALRVIGVEGDRDGGDLVPLDGPSELLDALADHRALIDCQGRRRESGHPDRGENHKAPDEGPGHDVLLLSQRV